MESRAADFAALLREKQPSTRRSFCRQHIEDLLRKYSENTVRQMLVEYRKACRGQFTERQIREWLTYGKRRSRAHRKAYEGSVAARHAQLEPIDATGFVACANALLLASPGPRGSLAANVVGLLAVTGRRTAEIYHGSFAPSKYPHHLLFRGQLKTRNAPGTMQRGYHIPVLADPLTVLAAWETVRMTIGKLPPKEATSRYSRWLNDISSKHFKLRPHLLRAAYAAICYRAFAPETMSDTYYYARILGHRSQTPGSETPDLATAMSYERFVVTNLPALDNTPPNETHDPKQTQWVRKSDNRTIWVETRPVPNEKSRKNVIYRFADNPSRSYTLPASRFHTLYTADTSCAAH